MSCSSFALLTRSCIWNVVKGRRQYLNLAKTLCMDETAVYFEDARTQTVDLSGRRHMIIRSTGFASMRITVVASVWADGRKAPPVIIHKGNDSATITRQSGPVLTCYQKKAWVNSELLIRCVSVLYACHFLLHNSNKLCLPKQVDRSNVSSS